MRFTRTLFGTLVILAVMASPSTGETPDATLALEAAWPESLGPASVRFDTLRDTARVPRDPVRRPPPR